MFTGYVFTFNFKCQMPNAIFNSCTHTHKHTHTHTHTHTAGIALAVPDLGDLITLVGAVASSALALMFPPLFDILTFWKEKRAQKLLWMLVWLIKNILIIALGVVGSIFGTGAAIKNIVDFFDSENTSPNQKCPIVF